MVMFREEKKRQQRLFAFDATAPRRYVLRGRIATMDATASVIPDGVVCVENDSIACVAPVGVTLPPQFQQAPIVTTGGTIFPGLLELHNHPAYNAVPLWNVRQLFANRGQWRADALYKRQVANPASLLTHHPQEIYPKSVARFVECRALLGGVTTTQGLTISSLGGSVEYYKGLIRNVEFPSIAQWPIATDHINDFASFDEFNKEYGAIKNQSLARFVIHLCEGRDLATGALFNNLIDPTGAALIGNNLIAIHATALGAPQFRQLKAGAGIVWSPMSNFLLYGGTTDVAAAIAAGVSVALGCDWGPSGTKNLLGELKIAKITSDHLGVLFSTEQLVRMVTTVPAQMMGWDRYLGSIEQGKQADLLIVDQMNEDPYAGLIQASERNVIAITIGGKVRAARASIADPTGPSVELIHIAGQDLVLDLVDDPSHPLANVTLQASIATLSYALEHLPDLAKTFSSGHQALGEFANTFKIRLEMDEEVALDAMVAAPPIGPSDVDPMELDPITAVDDTTFIPRLKQASNVPAWLKAAL
jgi:5-methylthioadenosine/S-adenosylhomocysteine deaminase